MRNILYLIPSLEHSGAARQAVLLAANLPRDRFYVRVCVLGKSTPWAEALQAAGIEVPPLAASA